MAQHEPVAPLSEFDALLTKELSVTPSPEFLPRVRERIRLEPARSRWTLFANRWPLIAPLAAAAVILLAVGLLVWRGSTTPVPSSTSVASTTPPVEPQARTPSPEPRVPTFALRAPVGTPSPEPRVPTFALRAPVGKPSPESRAPTFALRATVGKPSTEYRTSEVIVDVRQRAALVSMLRLINQGQLTEDSFKTTTPAPVEIGVDPVAVSPIVVGGVLPSESDRK